MPIEKRRKGSKNIDDYIEDHEINKSRNSEQTTTKDVGNGSNTLTGWVVAIGVVLVIFIIFTFSKFNSLIGGNNTQDLERKITKLEGEIDTLKSNQWTTVWVYYGGGSDSLNNVSWIGEKSLGYPSAAKGKTCYIIGDKLRGVEGGAIGGYLGIAGNGGRYNYSTQYEANLNNFDQKIEIIKNVGSDKNLTKTERNNLYLSLTLLCH